MNRTQETWLKAWYGAALLALAVFFVGFEAGQIRSSNRPTYAGSKSAGEDVPPNEVEKLKFDLPVQYDVSSDFYISPYNGSNWNISAMQISIKYIQAPGVTDTRTYKVTGVNLPPNTSSCYQVFTGLNHIKILEAQLCDVKGQKVN